MEKVARREDKEEPNGIPRDLFGFIAEHQPSQQQARGNGSNPRNEQSRCHIIVHEECRSTHQPRIKWKKDQRNAAVSRRHITRFRETEIMFCVPVIPDLEPTRVRHTHRRNGLHAEGQYERLDSKTQPNRRPIPAEQACDPLPAPIAPVPPRCPVQMKDPPPVAKRPMRWRASPIRSRTAPSPSDAKAR